MYSLKAILDKEPIAIAAGLRSILYILVLMKVVNLGPDGTEVLAGIALTAEIVLGLFARNASKPVAVAQIDESQAFAEGLKAGGDAAEVR